MPSSPLEGIRVLDLCAYLAGPFAVTLLAQLGAEIIKIESVQRLDYLRLLGGFPTPDGYECSPAFNATNLNKCGITLNLNSTRGKEVFESLVKVSDVVAENFSPRVMENWGLTYDVLKDMNPALVMLSMPGFGSTGPWRDYVSFGPNVEMMAGIPTITGYPGGPPMMNGYTADPFASLMGAISVVVALQHRSRSGVGQHIDMSQVEAVTSFMGESFMDYAMNRKLRSRNGNRHQHLAPHGVYPCKGDDQWIAIAVCSEDEWARFCAAMDSTAWARNPRFFDFKARHKNHDELDILIKERTARFDKWELTRSLQQAGVPAAPVLTCAELASDPHLEEREFFRLITHPVTGEHRYYGFPVKFSKTPVAAPRPAPTLGQHNDFVLREVLGMEEEEIRQLAEEEVIGTKPQGWPYAADVAEEEEKEKKFMVMDGGAGLFDAASRQAAAGDEGGEA